MDKAELKHKFIRGNKRAFDAIYTAFADAMFAICLRYTKNTDEASDILQDAFIKIYEKRKKFNPEHELQGWIKKIVINTAIDHFNKNKKIILIENETYFENDFDQHMELTQESTANINQLLIETLQSLPEGYRMIFNMYVMENLTHQEIADYLKISVNTSKSQLSRAKKMIQKLFEEKNMTYKKLNNAERA